MIPAFTDKGASEEFGRKLQLLAERKGSHAPLGPELLRWIEDLPTKTLERLAKMRLLDPGRLAGAKPLENHLEDFRDALRPGRNKRHVDQIYAKAKAVVDGCGFKFWQDIRADSVDAYLRRLRAGEDGVGLQTSNYYLGAIRQFCRWMVAHGRASESPLTVLRPLNATVDRRKVRRALSHEELLSLLRVTVSWSGLSGPPRDRLTWSTSAS